MAFVAWMLQTSDGWHDYDGSGLAALGMLLHDLREPAVATSSFWSLICSPDVTLVNKPPEGEASVSKLAKDHLN